MDRSHNGGTQGELLVQIRTFVSRTSGLRDGGSGLENTEIFQAVDGKSIRIEANDLEEVLLRSDADGHDFIQVNFRSGRKILLTDTLIGFKPASLAGLDMTRLPKVVTTPDIFSVFEAIQEALHAGDQAEHEVALLRRVFESVISGGEAIGFNLAKERAWLGRIPATSMKVSA